ncbi:uncharacterized protein VTP21DRAFT_3621 [Calcarisporiella thermophila]|uniref:uncharacterized protein n=1 Tax=Calcarisporiella thermophila TaxID=911321 RepID=UPI0037449748
MKLATLLTTALVAFTLQAEAKKNIVGYFPNWLYAKFPVEQIPYSKYTHLNYAFAILNKGNEPHFTDDWAVESQLPKIVKGAHAAGTKVYLSIGGWTGCIKFSPMVKSAEGRKAFINWNINFIKKYDTDGVDIDWEYPGRAGAACNIVDPQNDTNNFLVLLKELRAALDKEFPSTHKDITMAVRVQPFDGPNGPLKDVSEFAKVVDLFNIMAYDINGAWAPITGPLAPFEFESGKAAPYSYVQGIHDWMAAGVPASKINAGLPFYGRSIQATADMTCANQYVSARTGAPKGDSDDAYWQDPNCSKEPGGLSGIWKWKNLRSEGVLNTPTSATGNWIRCFDQKTKTPWLFNKQTKVYVSYDDPVSLQHKVNYALCKDLGGVMVWDLSNDYYNGKFELLDVIQSIHGNKPGNCDSFPTTIDPGPTVTPTPTDKPTDTSKPPTDTPTPTPTDGPCSNGQTRCVDEGKKPEYQICDASKWITMSCPATLVCRGGNGGVYCDYPSKNAKANLKGKPKKDTPSPQRTTVPQPQEKQKKADRNEQRRIRRMVAGL